MTKKHYFMYYYMYINDNNYNKFNNNILQQEQQDKKKEQQEQHKQVSLVTKIGSYRPKATGKTIGTDSEKAIDEAIINISIPLKIWTFK